jgi:hypothetical protein
MPMSPDLILGLILAVPLLGGILLITLGFVHAGRRAMPQSHRSDAGGAALWSGSDSGGHCGPGDSGGSCDGGGGGG